MEQSTRSVNLHNDPDLDPLASSDPDLQFRRDLELAKRLSLESQKEEEERRNFISGCGRGHYGHTAGPVPGHGLSSEYQFKVREGPVPEKLPGYNNQNRQVPFSGCRDFASQSDLMPDKPLSAHGRFDKLPDNVGRSTSIASLQPTPRVNPPLTGKGRSLQKGMEGKRSESLNSSDIIRPRPGQSSKKSVTRNVSQMSEMSIKPSTLSHKGQKKEVRLGLEDLISFKETQTEVNTLNLPLDDLYAQKPNLLSPINGSTEIQPQSRTIFPVIDQNNKLQYPNVSQFYQPYQQQQQQPLSLQPQLEYHLGYVPRQSTFNQTIALPKPENNFFATNLKQTSDLQTAVSIHDSMVKSQSWTDGKLSGMANNDNQNQSLPNDPPIRTRNSPTNGQQSLRISAIKKHSASSMKNSQSDSNLKEINESRKDSLIDFGFEEVQRAKQKVVEHNLTRVSVLEAFDPLLMTSDQFNSEWSKMSTDSKENDQSTTSFSDTSFYDSYDPFEYLTAEADRQVKSEEETDQAPVKRQNIRKHARQPSLTEGADFKTVERRKKQKADYEKVVRKNIGRSGKKIFELVTQSIQKEKDIAVDTEIRAFTEMVAKIRSKFEYDDPNTNSGYVTSAFIKSAYPPHTSVKVVIASTFMDSPFNLTCDVETSVEHLIMEVILNMDLEPLERDASKFLLKVSGKCEYLDPQSKLDDYEYVHLCYKYDRDVNFNLVTLEEVERPYLRTADDDITDAVVKVEDISPMDQIRTLSYDDLQILLETLENEAEELSKSMVRILNSSEKTSLELKPNKSLQAVKAICAFLGNIETLEVQETCEELSIACEKFNKSALNTPKIVDQGDERYSSVILTRKSSITGTADKINRTLEKMRESLQKMIEVYAKTFRVNFSLNTQTSNSTAPKETVKINETFLLRLCALHRLKPNWDYEYFCATLQIYHGTRPIADALTTDYMKGSESFYERVKFDSWMEMKSVTISSLPRESRLVFTIYGQKIDKESGKRQRYELGWGSLQLFDFQRFLAQGTFLLPLWSRKVEKRIGPAPDPGSHPGADKCPVISIELPEMNSQVYFPDKIPIEMPPRQDYNFRDLPFSDQQMLKDICDQDLFSFMELPVSDREVLWEKRHYLRTIPGSLPKVLLAANSWDYASLPRLYGLLHSWDQPKPMDILQLFLPIFPDTQVRQNAIEWLAEIGTDELVDYLPQLIEALKHETWSVSPLVELIMERSLQSPRVAHTLYWILMQSLPGITPQNTQETTTCSSFRVARYRRRLQMLMRSLYTIGGQALRNSFCKQQELLKYLYEAASDAKETADPDLRLKYLRKNMEKISRNHLALNATPIPLSPAIIASGIDANSTSFFPSKTLPLKIVFCTLQNDINENHEVWEPDSHPGRTSKRDNYCYLNPTNIPVIYKVGDDLRQDMLTMQMIRVMDKMWLEESLDLKMVTFACIPTGDKQGMMEMVTEAKTLREIQVTGSRGVTGSFKETPISDWLEKHNPSQLEFGRAVDNFTRSCAGYSIATYILGICDRHNDNIMIKKSGHLFHIDFGKFLGDAEKFGNFKRDRAPFVLSPDMVYVINGGDKPTQKFQDFVDLCCKGFNIIRKNGNHLLNLFALMASSGIPHVTMDAVNYVQRALLPDLSPTEASATFSRMIEESLSSWFVQWNFFFHNLAQRKFSNESGEAEGELLSFIPKRYSQASDGRISVVQVYDIQKRYNPERHYVFILKISRVGMKDPTYLFRTYKEFCEFDMKLGAQFHDIDFSLRRTGFSFRRQEIREVAQRRKHHIALFLDSLFKCHDSVAHCDLVYTFFHPLLRDQKEVDIQVNKLRDRKSPTRSLSAGVKIQGEIKLGLEYKKGVLYVMVHHARDLSLTEGPKEEPNAYVKVYLKPDPQKFTKRKTKVVSKNRHPSFMEMLEYRMNLSVVKCRTLEATVWDYDRIQENMFLGSVFIPLDSIKLTQETTKWYKLTNFQRFPN